jgi:hypothetical protein
MQTVADDFGSVWGEYPDWNAIARFVYGRRMWRLPEMRVRLLTHWRDRRHPYREHFEAHHELIEEVLGTDLSDAQLDAILRGRKTSLRCVARDIPPVFGSFFK